MFNSTNNIYKHINQYSADVLNNYKITKTHNVKKTHYNFTSDVVINKHGTINTNDIYGISKTNNTFHTTDNYHFTKEIHNTSNITNNFTRHNHNNYEHNVIKKVNRHLKHISNYGTEINCYSKKSIGNSILTSIMILSISERLGTSHYLNKLILQMI